MFKTVKTLLTGLLAGTALGILYGKEIKKEIQDKTKKADNFLKENLTPEARAGLNKNLQRARTTLESGVRRAKQKAQEVVADLKTELGDTLPQSLKSLKSRKLQKFLKTKTQSKGKAKNVPKRKSEN